MKPRIMRLIAPALRVLALTLLPAAAAARAAAPLVTDRGRRLLAPILSAQPAHIPSC